MKRTAWMLVAFLGSAISLHAEDAHKTMTMKGSLCNSKCVSENSGHASCDQKCTDQNGEIVLIDDKGKVMKIVNQDKVKSYAGKKVKMKCRPAGDAHDSMYVDSVSLYGGGG